MNATIWRQGGRGIGALKWKGKGYLSECAKSHCSYEDLWIFLVTSIPKEIKVNCLCFKVVSCRSEKKLGLCQEFSSWGTYSKISNDHSLLFRSLPFFPRLTSNQACSSMKKKPSYSKFCLHPRVILKLFYWYMLLKNNLPKKMEGCIRKYWLSVVAAWTKGSKVYTKLAITGPIFPGMAHAREIDKKFIAWHLDQSCLFWIFQLSQIKVQG